MATSTPVVLTPKVTQKEEEESRRIATTDWLARVMAKAGYPAMLGALEHIASISAGGGKWEAYPAYHADAMAFLGSPTAWIARALPRGYDRGVLEDAILGRLMLAHGGLPALSGGRYGDDAYVPIMRACIRNFYLVPMIAERVPVAAAASARGFDPLGEIERIASGRTMATDSGPWSVEGIVGVARSGAMLLSCAAPPGWAASIEDQGAGKSSVTPAGVGRAALEAAATEDLRRSVLNIDAGAAGGQPRSVPSRATTGGPAPHCPPRYMVPVVESVRQRGRYWSRIDAHLVHHQPSYTRAWKTACELEGVDFDAERTVGEDQGLDGELFRQSMGIAEKPRTTITLLKVLVNGGTLNLELISHLLRTQSSALINSRAGENAGDLTAFEYLTHRSRALVGPRALAVRLFVDCATVDGERLHLTLANVMRLIEAASAPVAVKETKDNEAHFAIAGHRSETKAIEAHLLTHLGAIAQHRSFLPESIRAAIATAPYALIVAGDAHAAEAPSEAMICCAPDAGGAQTGTRMPKELCLLIASYALPRLFDPTVLDIVRGGKA
jgi:hypothetical protein